MTETRRALRPVVIVGLVWAALLVLGVGSLLVPNVAVQQFATLMLGGGVLLTPVWVVMVARRRR